MWHFFGMWLFAINGVVYVLYNILTRHGRRTTIFGKSDVSGVLPMILYYLRIRKEHPPQKKYNALQKLAYTIVPLLALAGILSGIAIYWPVQFSGITSLFGGYETARVWHFICMSALVLFFAGHLLMVAIAGWDNFLSMITGWRKVPRSASGSSEEKA
jgi:thiosulfate reductase cytochrome b subunit